MILYGTAALALCMLVGAVIGHSLGALLGVDADIGGVGFAMVLLIYVSSWLRSKGHMPKSTERGILFWSGMYIPIVIAMSTIQNVAGAVSGGLMALMAGLVALTACAIAVPLVSKIADPAPPLPPITAEELEEA